MVICIENALFIYFRFLILFTIGGLTGLVLSNAGLDWYYMIRIMLCAFLILCIVNGCSFAFFSGSIIGFGSDGYVYSEESAMIILLLFLLVLTNVFSNAFSGISGMPRRVRITLICLYFGIVFRLWVNYFFYWRANILYTIHQAFVQRKLVK